MKNNGSKGIHNNAGSGIIYGLGLIGAAIYFLQRATTFGDGVLGIVKAILWPAFLIYKLLEFLGI